MKFNLEKLLRWLVAFVFLIAGLFKLSSLDTITLKLASYDFIPIMLIPIVAKTIVILEISLGLLLLFGKWKRKVCLATLFLVFLFVCVACYDLVLATDVPCGCFGKVTWLELSPLGRLIQNLVLSFMILLILKYDQLKDMNWRN